jgi:pimeloyl-ACP methyl ester carboxylesterase
MTPRSADNAGAPKGEGDTLAAVKPVYRDVKVSGIRLRVAEVGSGPPMLLLHNIFLDGSSWDRCIQQLAKSFRVIAPDLPGFGESEKPPETRFGYSVDDFVHVITDLFAGLGLGPTRVVGHGLGGAVALSLASQSPELVSALVVVDALCYPTRPDLVRRTASLPLFGGLLFKQLWGRRLFTAYFREVLCAPHRTINSERIEHYYQTFNTPSARNSALCTLRATSDPRTVEVRVGRISTPVLVVWGRHDAVYPAAFGRRLAHEVRGAGFQLLDTGHTPPEEAPDELSEQILKFCGAPNPA